MYCSHHVPLNFYFFLLKKQLYYPTNKLENMTTFSPYILKFFLLCYVYTHVNVNIQLKKSLMIKKIMYKNNMVNNN
jgi:hypothetical protein